MELFPRLVELRSGEFDLADLENSTYEMEVDFVDNADGADVAQYNLYIAFDDNNAAGGDNTTESTLFKSYTPADFRAGPDGNLGLDVVISFAEVAAFAGVPLDSIFSGDRFQVRGEVVKTDGRVFGSTNSTSAITSAFRGIFDFNINATCPLNDDFFVGDYKVTYGSVYDAFPLFGADVQPFGPAPLDKVVTLALVPGSTTRRTFNIGAYLQPGYNFATSALVFDFACDVVTTNNIASGSGCGDGTLQASQDGVASFSLDDDSTLTINFIDFGETDGGCGVEGKPFSLVFTKQ